MLLKFRKYGLLRPMKKLALFIFSLTFFLSFFPLLSPVALADSNKTFSILDLSKLQYGKTNQSVSNLQNALNELGYEVTISGKYDSDLIASLKDFQRENSLDQTGRIDLSTLNTLNKLIVFLNKNSQSSNANTSGTPAEEEDISGQFNTDISDYYKSDIIDVYNGTGTDSEKFDAPLRYVGNALSSYTGVNIAKTLKPARLDNTVGQVETTKIPQTGNIFETAILKTIMGDSNVLILSGLEAVTNGLTLLGGNTKTETVAVPRSPLSGYSQSDIEASKRNVTTDGKFDPYKCMLDPICSKI